MVNIKEAIKWAEEDLDTLQMVLAVLNHPHLREVVSKESDKLKGHLRYLDNIKGARNDTSKD